MLVSVPTSTTIYLLYLADLFILRAYAACIYSLIDSKIYAYRRHSQNILLLIAENNVLIITILSILKDFKRLLLFTLLLLDHCMYVKSAHTTTKRLLLNNL